MEGSRSICWKGSWLRPQRCQGLGQFGAVRQILGNTENRRPNYMWEIMYTNNINSATSRDV
eukprot:854497-Pelagomonas_calceolata.AAC.5